MKVPILIIKRLPAAGMAIFPFILLKSAKLKNDPEVINHEKIHIRQQLELLILPFYLLYLGHFFINLIKYKNKDLAYRNISFEREAYTKETDLHYIRNRRMFQFLHYIKLK